MSEYTPTTDEITRYYIDGSRDWFPGLTASERNERFDRWLAEVRREAAEEAWDKGFSRGFYDTLAGGDRDACETFAINPYRKEADDDR